MTAKHTYIEVGNYLVTLTVKNNAPVPKSTVYQKVVQVSVQQQIRFETDGAVMHLIPAGEFEMGDHFGEGQSDERPVHTVYLDVFYMDETEVTTLCTGRLLRQLDIATYHFTGTRQMI